jgi:hypothetical protein
LYSDEIGSLALLLKNSMNSRVPLLVGNQS